MNYEDYTLTFQKGDIYSSSNYKGVSHLNLSNEVD